MDLGCGLLTLFIAAFADARVGGRLRRDVPWPCPVGVMVPVPIPAQNEGYFPSEAQQVAADLSSYGICCVS